MDAAGQPMSQGELLGRVRGILGRHTGLLGKPGASLRIEADDNDPITPNDSDLILIEVLQPPQTVIPDGVTGPQAVGGRVATSQRRASARSRWTTVTAQ